MSPMLVDSVPAVQPAGIHLNGVSFTYPSSDKPFIADARMEIPKGARCLLVGANGTGKTTLLQLVAGKYMVATDSLYVLGRSPFHDTQLTCNGELSYLGTSWRKDVAFAGYGVPLQGDMSAGKMLFGVEGVCPERRSRLIEMLDIDLYQRMNTMSDGQRRRVQICMGLLKPYKVLLLDEITVDLDVVARLRLLNFFKRECEERDATILYATHIFDGLENWVTHLAYMEEGAICKSGNVAQVAELAKLQSCGGKLLTVVEVWLRDELEKRHKAKAEYEAIHGPPSMEATVRPNRTPNMPNKHLAFFR